MGRWKPFRIGAAAALCAAAAAASAATPRDLQAGLESAARAANPAFTGFSAARGERFFKQAHGGEWSCASCHSQDPRATGRHARTGKAIGAMAPAANAERFTDPAFVEKWFRRNCKDVLSRECTAQEKGDVMQYLISLK